MKRLLPISSLSLFALSSRIAQVIFDDAIVSVDDILGATAEIGYELSMLTAVEDS